MVVLGEPELWSSIVSTLQKLQLVSPVPESLSSVRINVLTGFLDKFSGYQYGGRPLGLTFVKYLNPGAGDVMNGSGVPAGLTQDQIM